MGVFQVCFREAHDVDVFVYLVLTDQIFLFFQKVMDIQMINWDGIPGIHGSKVLVNDDLAIALKEAEQIVRDFLDFDEKTKKKP